MYGLSWTIDGAIGINHHLTRLPRAVVVIAIPCVSNLFRTGLVGIGIGKDICPPVIRLEEALALRIRRQLMYFLSGQTRFLTDTHLRIGNGLSCRGLHHHIACRLVWLSLPHHINVGHEIQHTSHRSVGL